MNANELALFQDDLAKEWEYEGIEAKELRESATMLRQLQVENEAKRISNKELHEEIWLLKDEVYRLKARLIKLKGAKEK